MRWCALVHCKCPLWGEERTSAFSVSSDKKARASKPGGLFRKYDEIGLDSGLIAQGIVRDDKCGAWSQ